MKGIKKAMKEKIKTKKITSQEMMQIQIKILEYIIDICDKNNIEYFMIGGSLIGTIRHNGFIPWDDDIDIALLREDYNRLLNILLKTQNTQYKVIDKITQKDYFYPFFKVMDKTTILKEKKFKEIKEYGIYVDVFAIDGLPKEEKLLNKRYKKQKNLQRLIFLNNAKKIEEKNPIKKIGKQLLVIYSHIIGNKRILEQYDKVCTKYSAKKTEYAISNWPIYKKEKEIHKSKNFYKMKKHKFESLEVKVPVNYDEVLKTTFNDYMNPPPEEERKSHHEIEVYYK